MVFVIIITDVVFVVSLIINGLFYLFCKKSPGPKVDTINTIKFSILNTFGN